MCCLLKYKQGKNDDSRKVTYGFISTLFSKMGVFALLGILIIAGIFISDKFLTISNFYNIISAVSLLGIVALGVSFVTYSGHFADLSVPAIMAASGMISEIGRASCRERV